VGVPAPSDADVVAPGDSDVTFVVTSDLHYGSIVHHGNRLHAENINQVGGIAYPGSAGTTVDGPMGVLVQGDLTNNGLEGQLQRLAEDWFDDTSSVIGMPVYEGTGNHDYGNVGWKMNRLVEERIKARNAARPALASVSRTTHAYSWDWGNIHFVQLHDCGSWDLPFLEEDLQDHVGTSGRPVVLAQHYGFDSFSTQSHWWTDKDRKDFHDVIKSYNVIAIFNGHSHNQQHHRFFGINVYDAGGRAAHGQYLVVRISGNSMVIVGRIGDAWNGNIWRQTIEGNGS
jgi:cytolysin (calcineurin-like family phosphatase)